MIFRNAIYFILFCFLSSISFTPRAQALTAGEAVLTVAGGALAGTVLGASTLPFYGSPGDHMQNIWIGAAVGTVVGVLVSAAAGFTQTSESLDAEDQQNMTMLKQPKPALEFSPALAGSHLTKQDTVLAWQPLATLRF